MPRTELTVQSIGRTTALEDPVQNTPDASNGNRFDNSTARVFLYVRNGSVSTKTMTVVHPGLVDSDLTVSDRAYAIPAGERWVIGPFPSSYNQTLDSDTNQVALNWSDSSSVTIEVMMLPSA